MKNLELRTAENCQDYVKPGVNLEELNDEFNSRCGCSPDHPSKCTDAEVKQNADGTLSCEASEDCQKAIQKNDDIWKEGPITNPLCRLIFDSSKLLNAICIH